jgi:hypothetical protein
MLGISFELEGKEKGQSKEERRGRWGKGGGAWRRLNKKFFEEVPAENFPAPVAVNKIGAVFKRRKKFRVSLGVT